MPNTVANPRSEIVIGGGAPRHLAGKLRDAVQNVLHSIPRSVREIVRDVEIVIADLGEHDGRRIRGGTTRGGHTIIIDRDTIDELPDGAIENVVGHEYGHAARELQGVALDDEYAEEEAVVQLTRSWGFRRSKHWRGAHGV